MFDNVLEDIEGVFAGVSWTVNSINTYPDNYQGDITDGERVSVSILPSTGSNVSFGASDKQLSGLVAVKIFVLSGEGQGRLMEIADLLDTVLENKNLANGTRLGASYLSVEGIDSANSALYSATYFIPFILYGG